MTGGDGGPVDGELADVIRAWPTLPDPIRRGILAMVEAANTGGER